MSIVAEVADYPGLPAPAAAPKASVIIVAYNTSEADFSDCLNSLQKQSSRDFEVIVVDNSDKAGVQKFACRYALKYIRLRKNYGLTIGRNVGIKYARAEILIFLDDDSISTEDLIEQHINAYKKYDIWALRGKVLPKTSNIYNYLSREDDLGDQVMPWLLNMECNISCRKSAVIEAGGFISTLPKGGGHEGAELTHRIVGRHNDRNKVIYYPSALIYHDSYGNFKKYLRKALRHANSGLILRHQVPGLFEFVETYRLPKKKGYCPLSFFGRAKVMLMGALIKSIVVSYKLWLKSFASK
jgi:glycosyltransferase involved in cell wall biosynthesis